MPTPSTTSYADIEALLHDWLTSVLGYENVTFELPTNLVFVMPLVVVERFGGADATITLDQPTVDIDVFAASREDARAHAESIRQALRTKLPGRTFRGAVVQRVRTISGPTKAPYDSRGTVRRFTAAYQIQLHQFAGV